MSAPIEMDERKTSPSNTAGAPASSDVSPASDTSQKENDLTFLDLGWGLESIGVSHPYRQEYVTLAYTISSLIISVLIIAIPSFIPVVILSVINAVFQCSLFLYCLIKFKSRETPSRRNSIETKLSMSIDHDSPFASRSMDRSPSMSPSKAYYFSVMPSLASVYKFSNPEDSNRKSCRRDGARPCLDTLSDFCASFDETFGRGDDPVFLRPYFFRFHAVLYGVIASLFTLGVVLSARDSPLNICAASYAFWIYGAWHPEWQEPSYVEHFQQHGELTCSYTLQIFEFCTLHWLQFIVFSLFDLHELKEEYYTRTNTIFNKALDTFKATKIKDLYQRVEASIYVNVKSRMQFVSNWQLILILYITIYAALIGRRYSDPALNNLISFPVIFVSIIEASVVVNMIMTMFKACQLCKYPWALSNAFGEPIYCQSRDDVLAWWQLRHIYLAYRQPIYIFVLNPALFQTFIWAIILPFWAVMGIIEDKKSGQDFWPYPIQFSITVVLVTIILYAIKQFVASWEKHKAHIGMLQKEVIRMKVNNQDFEEINELIQLLSDHITQFDKPIHIGGIPMTGAVFALLRGGFSAAALAIASEIANASSKDNE
eukprot:460527_1